MDCKYLITGEYICNNNIIENFKYINNNIIEHLVEYKSEKKRSEELQKLSQIKSQHAPQSYTRTNYPNARKSFR